MELTLPYKVADLSQADWGRKEMQLSENEMPGLMAVIKKYGPKKPLAGMRITGSLHMALLRAKEMARDMVLHADQMSLRPASSVRV